MKDTNQNLKEQSAQNQMPEQVVHALQILEELENFTAELRKKIMAELKTNNNSVHLKLNDM